MDFKVEQIFFYLQVLILGIVIVSIGPVFMYFYEKNRTKHLKQSAKNLGLSFSKLGREGTLSKHANFKLFSQGRCKKLRNEMEGINDNNQISIFDYSYDKKMSSSTTTFRFTVMSIECHKLCAPHFELVHENFGHKLNPQSIEQDIDFELFPTFSKRYFLNGKDEAKIREFFTPELIDLFEWNLGLCIEVQENIIIIYTNCKRCKPYEIRDFIKNAKVVFSKFTSA